MFPFPRRKSLLRAESKVRILLAGSFGSPKASPKPGLFCEYYSDKRCAHTPTPPPSSPLTQAYWPIMVSIIRLKLGNAINVGSEKMNKRKSFHSVTVYTKEEMRRSGR